MKKLIIFESILIIFFVLAWNVSNADEFLDALDRAIFCESIEKSIETKIRSYNIIWEEYPNVVAEGDKEIIMNFNRSLDRDIDELYKYTTIYDSLCKF